MSFQIKRSVAVICLSILTGILPAETPITKEFLSGRFNPDQNPDFTVISPEYCDKSGMYMNKEAYSAYITMYEEAKKDGITLVIISATRNFDRQKVIWKNKWKRLSGDDTTKVKNIMRYSSMPGTSRHHWGSDIDFISVEPGYWIKGEGLKVYNWLKDNAFKFGFFQPYTDDPKRTGYAEERWHWSYAPLSIPYLETFMSIMKSEDITGFSGSETVGILDIINTHVSGITPYPMKIIGKEP